MPQYRYGYNDQGIVVDVMQLAGERADAAGPFTCIGCDNPLIAKIKGEKRVKHFAHKSQGECNEETYLHKLAKHTFYHTYLQCLEDNEPFHIELTHPKECTRWQTVIGTSCDLGGTIKTYDLTMYFTGIALEKRDDRFVPDVMLYSKTKPDEKVYIEIAVTHFLSEDKSRSSYRIIEIPVDVEDDIEKIKGRKLTERDVSFLNFTRNASPVTDAECECSRRKFYCLFIYNSGKSYLQHATLCELYTARKRQDHDGYTRLVSSQMENDYEPGALFAQLVSEAYQRGYPVRNCLLCRFSGRSWDAFDDNPIFCKLKKISCGTNEAVGCDKYWVRADLVNRRKTESTKKLGALKPL